MRDRFPHTNVHIMQTKRVQPLEDLVLLFHMKGSLALKENPI